jgi:hypothetical protein
MKRSPLKRRTELRAKRAWRPKRRKADIPASVRAYVEGRSWGWCELMEWTDCGQRATHMHHKRLRSQGGQHTASNLLHVCANCHNHIHTSGAVAYARGWLTRTGDDR